MSLLPGQRKLYRSSFLLVTPLRPVLYHLDLTGLGVATVSKATAHLALSKATAHLALSITGIHKLFQHVTMEIQLDCSNL
jgi:hypothetical protein